MTPHGQLKRTLGVFDASAIGLGSMLGAGVFVVFAPASSLAGEYLVLAVLVAGVVAYCNAVASAVLAAKYPDSGGTYIYGRKQLGNWAGFLAGWGFVTGKTASCAAMALTFGLYVAPDRATLLAVAAVLALTGVNLLGITRTALLTRILLGIVLATLVVVAAAAVLGPHPADTITGPGTSAGASHPAGILPAAGLLFFAFAGYARIATLGGEVRNPERTIPRAILAALAAAFAIYLALAVLLPWHLPAGILTTSASPLLDAVRHSALAPAAWVVSAGAAAACLGALLALVAGVGRTAMAMAREGDLPRSLGTIRGQHAVPVVAELTVCVAVIVLLLSADVMTVVGFSSFGVLLYYAVANAAAFTLTRHPGYAPRWLNAVGFTACLVLAATLPIGSVAVMLAVLASGIAGRWAALLLRQKNSRK